MVSRVEDRKTDNDLATKRSAVKSMFSGFVLQLKFVEREILIPFLLLICLHP